MRSIAPRLWAFMRSRARSSRYFRRRSQLIRCCQSTPAMPKFPMRSSGEVRCRLPGARGYSASPSARSSARDDEARAQNNGTRAHRYPGAVFSACGFCSLRISSRRPIRRSRTTMSGLGSRSPHGVYQSVAVVFVLLVVLGMLAPPSSAQTPAPKVTISGLVDFVTTAYWGLGQNSQVGAISPNQPTADLGGHKHGWYSRERGVFTITGGVG